MASPCPIKKHLDLRGSLKRGGNSRRHHPRRTSERSTLLSASRAVIAASQTIWPRHAILLVLNAGVQYGGIPLGAIAGAVRGRCGLENKNNFVILKICDQPKDTHRWHVVRRRRRRRQIGALVLKCVRLWSSFRWGERVSPRKCALGVSTCIRH